MHVKNTSCDKCKNPNCLINKHCSLKWKSYLGSKRSFLKFKNKKTIFSEGGMISGMFFIRHGKVKIYNSSRTNENIIRMAGSGEMLGFRAFTGDTYMVSAATLEDSSLCFFKKEIFINTLKENPEFALHLLDLYALELGKIEIQHKHSNRLNAKGKLSETLLMVCEKFGVALGENEVLLDVALSRHDIAAIAGISTAETIRTLTAFQKEKLIKKEKTKIIISNPNKLREFILECKIKFKDQIE